MSRALDTIKSVNDSKELWKLGVRLEDIWTVTNQGKEHLEFIILDKQGDQIQVLLPSDVTALWKSTLVEGETYVMKNFKVHDNNFAVKYCLHPFKLQFVGGEGGSNITKQDIPDIPLYKLHFKPIPEILNGQFRSDILVDIIGAVDDIKPLKTSNVGKKQPARFCLKDAAMNMVPCTLWGNFASDFMTFYNAKSDDSPMIIIIKHAQIKEPQGQYDLTVSNAWSGSKLILDPNTKEIMEFAASLPNNFTAPTLAVSQTLSGNVNSSQNSQVSQYSIASRYTYLAPPKQLSELMTCAEDQVVTTVGTTHHVMTSKHGWFYLVCGHCNKQVITSSPPYKCQAEHVTVDPLIKYKVEVEVRYQDHKARFLFWDRECQQLIGKSALELKNIMLKEGQFGAHEYPQALDDITGKELALKVKAQPYFSIVSVLNLKNDPDIIQYIKDQLPTNEITSQLVVEDDTTADPTNEPMEDSPIDTPTESLTPIPTQDLSATGESFDADVKKKTPAKRVTDDSSPDDAKLSSNKILRKPKIEKLGKQRLEM